MWRSVMIIVMLVGAFATAPAVSMRDETERPSDLAAMVVPPSSLPEPGYQFSRGGYLEPDDVRYLLGDRYSLEPDTIERVFAGAGWRQGYTGTLVLLSDRAWRTSDPIVRHTTTIHELADADGVTLVGALLTGSPPEGAEARDAAVDDATTWRVVTSQDDALVTVVQAGRYLIEIETAGRVRTPTDVEHAAVVRATLGRIAGINATGATGLSQRFVPLDDPRLIPVGVATEYPLAHTWYRLIDGEVVPAAGELEPPAPSELGPGIEEIAITRQTAELASQNWVTAGIVTARFSSAADAGAFAGVLRDPLDVFSTTADASPVDAEVVTGDVEALAGEARVGGRWSGFRITIVEDATVAQLTIRAMGSTLIAQEAAELWAEAQRVCLANGACEAMSLASLLRPADPGTTTGPSSSEGVFTSTVAPWSVAFDPAVWRIDDTFAQGGYDYLYLRADAMDATFETVVDHHGDLERCVLDELDRLRDDEEHASITVGSDDVDAMPGGLTEHHGWIVYTVEPLEGARAGQEYVTRIDCWTLVERSTSLVMQVRAPRDRWSELAPMTEKLRSRIEIDGVPVGRETGDLSVAAPTTRSDEMIDRRPWVGVIA